jgi:hypothetical protein
MVSVPSFKTKRLIPKPWGRGLIAEAVKPVLDFAFKDAGFDKLTNSFSRTPLGTNGHVELKKKRVRA